MATVTISDLECPCPRCGSFFGLDAEALIGSGGHPQNTFYCPACEITCIAEVSVDIYVRERKKP